MNMCTKTTIVLQYVHNRHQCNTGDGGQAMGEELRWGMYSWSQGISRWSKQAHRWRKWTTMGHEAVSSALEQNISLQKQVARVENNVYTYKSW